MPTKTESSRWAVTLWEHKKDFGTRPVLTEYFDTLAEAEQYSSGYNAQFETPGAIQPDSYIAAGLPFHVIGLLTT
jgi:hypothetical protein